jgi:LysM repeat protein
MSTAATIEAAKNEARPGPARLTRRGRVVMVAVLLLACLVVLSFGRPSVATTTPPEPAHYTTVTVQPGQTLWEIARSVAPDTDPRATIARIVDLNALPSAHDIRPGQRIALPLG